MVTVTYEYARHRRTTGKTANAGFEISVTKTIHVTPSKAWRFLASPKGLSVWLGQVRWFKLIPGFSFQAANGIKGVLRTIKLGVRLRLTYQQPGTARPSTLQLTMTRRQSTKGTCIRFHQEKLGSSQERENMRVHWQQILSRLQEMMEEPRRN